MNSIQMWKQGQLIQAIVKRKGFPIRRAQTPKELIALVLEDQKPNSQFVNVLLNDGGNVSVTKWSPFSQLVEVKILNNV